MAGCPPDARRKPETLFAECQRDFFYGNLDIAQKKADAARIAYAGDAAGWAARFRLLEARALAYQGRRADLTGLLGCGDPASSLQGDEAIERLTLCGQAHARMGEQSLSGAELLQASRLAHASSSRLAPEVLMTQGHVEFYQGHLGEAAVLYRASLAGAAVQGDAFLQASNLSNLGMVDLGLEHYDEALASFQKASRLAASHALRGITEPSLGNAGVAYFYLGDFEKALGNFQQAEEQAKLIGTTTAQIDWLLDAGSCYFQLGDRQQAAARYLQALQLAKAIHDAAETAAIDAELGLLRYQEKRYVEAQLLSQDALAAARLSGDRQDEAEARLLQAMLATHGADAAQAEFLLLQALKDVAAIPSQKSAIEGELADFYRKQQKPRQADVWYRRSIATFEADRAAVRDEELRLPFFANGEGLYRGYADFLVAGGRLEQALQLLDRGRSRTLSDGLRQPVAMQDQRLTARAVARKLDATILFYSLGAEKSDLWAVNARHSEHFVLPDAAAIAVRVQAYNSSIQRSIDLLGTADKNGQALFAELIAPAASLVPRGSRVIVIPDEGLNALNFETLITGDAAGLHYWIDDVTVMTASSLRMLAGSSRPRETGTGRTLLLMGDPALSGKDYATLPNAALEARNVARHFALEKSTTLTQARAVPSAYGASGPERYSYIHFVTHGTASALSPLDSAVVLSPAPGQPENFKLYAREIVRHPLQAQLVTISACYGSGLRAYAGEGLVGLSWAFLRAGAHNVIGALWEVNDASTPQLMDSMYAAIEQGKAPGTALREAKLQLIHSPGVYRKPLYWAAFQLYAGS